MTDKTLDNRRFPRYMHATVPMTARLEPWMQRLLADPAQCANLLQTYDSPVNVLAPHVLPRNADELVRAGEVNGVEVCVFYARKANKGLSFVDAALAAGHGIDVASERELLQVLSRGAEPGHVILSAAVKPDRLLQHAVGAGVYISVDSVAEMQRIQAVASATSATARIVPRIAPNPNRLPPTRFGELAGTWEAALQQGLPESVQVHGVHLHLHGYSEADRRIALADAIAVVDTAVLAGHPVSFIDLGGGVPMSYLDAKPEWDNFQKELAAARAGEREPFTWKGDPLNNTYPFWQEPTRGEWLKQLLAGQLGGDVEDATFGESATAHESFTEHSIDSDSTVPVAEALRSRNLRLHMEPGRSVLDGGGVILARVAFVKKRSDGVDIVGLEMNRTQCRTTSDDILLDPVLVPAAACPTAPDSHEVENGSQAAVAENGSQAAAENGQQAAAVNGQQAAVAVNGSQAAAENGQQAAAADQRENAGLNAFLVGAYCIEDEVIIRRAMHFPDGVQPGDIIAIPNTAGYFMHILESASHQIPLARNVFVDSAGANPLPDEIDLITAARANADSARGN
ncbi:type III PLP-dependent enzyme domain-containing protein [Corynebacterium auriscanis]|uniref:Y4yA family PLP-dependent enzyme n=1 Tax=Corynebacterium auriscanis TaxID=99807 RepID=UPI002247C0CF|nr:Y4yA family PLP-dependent enzyme [Corynebacterium auriscanis]MCX2163593.1 Y4yA family PLP-dependent enzyme [Corynebacterium auriscanis]